MKEKKMTEFQKRVKGVLEASSKASPEKVVCRKGGEVVCKRSYFYRHGDSAEKFAGRVASVLVANGMKVTVQSRDDWAAWPKSSYFVATVREG